MKNLSVVIGPVSRLVLLASVLVWGILPAGAKSKTKEEPQGVDYVYKTVEGRDLHLYVVAPPKTNTTPQATSLQPAIVFFHGGGWVGGAPAIFNSHTAYFASRGLVSITVQYRLLDHSATESPLRCIQDAKSAMRWVRSHAVKLGIDPNRIASAGGSAGGHLAAFCGMVDGLDDPQDDLKVSARSQAMVLFNPVFNNGPGQYGNKRVGELYKNFSPAHNISNDDPPAIVFLGTEDALIPVKTVTDFQAEMRRNKVRCDVKLYEGQKHGFYSRNNAKYFYETTRAADEFLASLGWLQGPPTLEMPVVPEKKPVENPAPAEKK